MIWNFKILNTYETAFIILLYSTSRNHAILLNHEVGIRTAEIRELLAIFRLEFGLEFGLNLFMVY